VEEAGQTTSHIPLPQAAEITGFSGSVLSTVMFVHATTLSSLVAFTAACAVEIGRASSVQSARALALLVSLNIILSLLAGVTSGTSVGNFTSVVIIKNIY